MSTPLLFMQSLKQTQARLQHENPFYGMGSLLNMLNQLPKASDSITKAQVHQYLQCAWTECNTLEKRQLFFVVLFSIGDVQNREHNIFKKKGIKDVDNGGHSKRKVFTYCLDWMLTSIPGQFYKFMPILGEYYNLDVFKLYRLTTDRKTGILQEVLHLNVDLEQVTGYVSSVLRNTHTSDNEKSLWARWLPHIPTAKRIRKYTITEKNIKAFQKNYPDVKLGDVVTEKKDKQAATCSKDTWITSFITKLSEKMSWQTVKHAKNIEFRGYKQFRKRFLEDSEAALFSSKRIVDMDETQILTWFNQLPSGARHRVACRLVYKNDKGDYMSKGKWTNKFGVDIASIYIKWLASKETAQQALRELTTEQKSTMTTKEVRDLQKAARVNTGGDTILDVIADVVKCANMAEADVRIQSLLDMIILQVPLLMAVDISGSMASRGIMHKGVPMTAAALSRLLITMFLLKNPSEELSDMFIRFHNKADVVAAGESLDANGRNRYMATSEVKVPQLIDKTKPFSWNYESVSKFITSTGATTLTSVSQELHRWVNADGGDYANIRTEWINKYPVLCIVSDGDINNASNAMQSVQVFQQEMRQFFGWEGVVILWDIRNEDELSKGKFEGLNNFLHLSGFNPGTLNTMFKRLHDLDIIDSYLPLKALYDSNRYIPVKELVA